MALGIHTRLKTRTTKVLMIGAAVLHLSFVALCFGAALLNPDRSALAPIFVFMADVPASFICEFIRHALHHIVSDSYASRMATDMIVYSLIGTAWWVGLAWCIGRLISFARSARV
jgi:hypothetical protein